MTTTEPKVNTADKYELKETAEAMDVSKATILRWTRNGALQLGGVKKTNNRKFWYGRDIIRAWRATY